MVADSIGDADRQCLCIGSIFIFIWSMSEAADTPIPSMAYSTSTVPAFSKVSGRAHAWHGADKRRNGAPAPNGFTAGALSLALVCRRMRVWV
jgi:hypothetical protein